MKVFRKLEIEGRNLSWIYNAQFIYLLITCKLNDKHHPRQCHEYGKRVQLPINTIRKVK